MTYKQTKQVPMYSRSNSTGKNDIFAYYSRLQTMMLVAPDSIHGPAYRRDSLFSPREYGTSPKVLISHDGLIRTVSVCYLWKIDAKRLGHFNGARYGQVVRCFRSTLVVCQKRERERCI